MTNPLFPQDDENPHKNPLSEGPQYGSALKREPKRIEPLAPENNAAANIIRQKLQSIYSAEPNAEKELAEAEKSTHPRSKHQQFMEGLERSGKTVPQIQEAWHDYYAALSDKEKHEVWQEFYSAAATLKTKPNKPEPTTPLVAVTAAETTGSSVVVAEHQPPPSIRDRRSVASIRRALLSNLERQATTKLKARDHLKSLGFGLASGVIVIAIFLFSFFNEIIIAPFIQPSRHVGSLPLIVDATTASATSTPEVIIPSRFPLTTAKPATMKVSLKTTCKMGSYTIQIRFSRAKMATLLSLDTLVTTSSILVSISLLLCSCIPWLMVIRFI
jgi:hypothetical protein